MMVLVSIFLAAAFLRGGYFAALSALALAFYLLIQDLNVNQYFLLTTLLISIPLSSYIAGLLLDRFIFKEEIFYRGLFSGFLFAASMFLILNSDQFFSFLDAALRVTLSTTQTTILILSGVNTSLLAGSVLALSVIVIILLTELPFKLFKVARKSYATLSFSALRPILTCFILAMTFHLTSNYLSANLFPDKIKPSFQLQREVNTQQKRFSNYRKIKLRRKKSSSVHKKRTPSPRVEE